MDVDTSHGFRVLVKVDSIKEEVLKCFIYVNSKKMRFIKDVEEHIKSILDLKDVTLYVKDAWLPSNETIKIIKEEDLILVKSINCPEIFRGNSNVVDHEEVTEVKRKRRKKDEDEDSSNLSLSLLQKELEVKRNELLQKDKNPTELDLSNDFETYDDINTFLSPPQKKKRSRKHKKKPTTKNTRPMIALKLLTPLHSHRKTKLSYSGVHTRFSDGKEEDSAEKPSEEDKPVAIVPSTVVRNLENTDSGNIEECLTKEIVKLMEPSINAQISNKNENSHNMVISDQTPTDQLNKSNETEAQMFLNAENGYPRTIYEVTTAEEGRQDSEQMEDNNWKSKLLSLINKDLESKVFYRKFPTQDVIQS